MDEKLLPGQSGPAASRRLINHHRSAGEHQPPKLPATGVQQYDVGEPAEALQEGLQEAWNFKLFLYQNYCHFGLYSYFATNIMLYFAYVIMSTLTLVIVH